MWCEGPFWQTGLLLVWHGASQVLPRDQWFVLKLLGCQGLENFSILLPFDAQKLMNLASGSRRGSRLQNEAEMINEDTI